LPFPFELIDISQCGSFRNCFTLNSRNQTIAVNLIYVPGTLQVFCFKYVTTFYNWGRTPAWHIAPEIANMVNLTDLIFWGLAGNEIPEVISELKQLKKLRIGGEELVELPPIISSLTTVTYLSIWAPLNYLPSFLNNLSLSELIISFSANFSYIPKDLFKKLNPTLRSLDLGDIGNIKSLDPFMELTQLTSFSRNQFMSLPNNISKTLVTVNLDGNNFTQILLPFLLSKQLRDLDLSANQIGTLKYIGLMNSSAIRSLDFGMNRIRSLS
jgi:leucine-rich repeat protein SHOC2